MKKDKEFTGYGNEENVIEWIRGNNRATLSLSQKRLISKIEKLAVSRSDECKIVHRNDDGSICAHIPMNWIKINPTKQLSDEQRNEIAKRFARE